MSRRERSEDGTMLVELLVGMILMSIVGLVVLDGIVGGFKAQRGLQNRGDALNEVRASAQRVTRQIREAQLVEAAADHLIIERTDSTGATERVQWSLSTTGGVTSLVQQSQTLSGTSWSTWTTPAATVIRGIDGTTLPFSYDKIPLWTAPSGSTVDDQTCAIAVTAPTLYSHHCVGKVSLHLVRQVAGHTPVTVDATVDLRNVS